MYHVHCLSVRAREKDDCINLDIKFSEINICAFFFFQKKKEILKSLKHSAHVNKSGNAEAWMMPWLSATSAFVHSSSILFQRSCVFGCPPPQPAASREKISARLVFLSARPSRFSFLYPVTSAYSWFQWRTERITSTRPNWLNKLKDTMVSTNWSGYIFPKCFFGDIETQLLPSVSSDLRLEFPLKLEHLRWGLCLLTTWTVYFIHLLHCITAFLILTDALLLSMSHRWVGKPPIFFSLSRLLTVWFDREKENDGWSVTRRAYISLYFFASLVWAFFY